MLRKSNSILKTIEFSVCSRSLRKLKTDENLRKKNHKKEQLIAHFKTTKHT